MLPPPDEKYLLAAAELGRKLVMMEIPPEKIAEMHEEALVLLSEEIPDMTIILCTAFSEKIDDEKAKELGIRKYIEKPFTMPDFPTAVRKVLDAGRSEAKRRLGGRAIQALTQGSVLIPSSRNRKLTNIIFVIVFYK